FPGPTAWWPGNPPVFRGFLGGVPVPPSPRWGPPAPTTKSEPAGAPARRAGGAPGFLFRLPLPRAPERPGAGGAVCWDRRGVERGARRFSPGRGGVGGARRAVGGVLAGGVRGRRVRRGGPAPGQENRRVARPPRRRAGERAGFLVLLADAQAAEVAGGGEEVV